MKINFLSGIRESSYLIPTLSWTKQSSSSWMRGASQRTKTEGGGCHLSIRGEGFSNADEDHDVFRRDARER